MGTYPALRAIISYRTGDVADVQCRNIGVLQTTVAEIVTKKEHQRKRNYIKLRIGD